MVRNIIFIIFSINLHTLTAHAESKYENLGRKEINDPLKVRGQTRNLNMLLVLQSKEDKIKFIKIRKTFNEEIRATQY